MKYIENDELLNINGGARYSITSLLNSFTKITSAILTVGRSFGSAIRRLTTSGGLCACR